MQLIEPIAGTEATKAVMSAGERLIQQGIEKGRAEGMEKGRAEGMEKGRAEGMEKGRAEGIERGRSDEARSLLLRQLEQRFGTLSTRDAVRIGAATLEELERWALRVIPAKRIDDVFAP